MTRTPERVEEELSLYINELESYGRRINLVGSTNPDALRLHVRDSVAAAPHLPQGARVVDLGSGAGFPGIPLLLTRRDLALTLVDSRERRIHFLRHIARVLALDCQILRMRIEETPPSTFPFVLLRAVAPLSRSLTLAAPWAGPEGEIWIWSREERTSALREIPLGERGRILRLPAATVSRETQ